MTPIHAWNLCTVHLLLGVWIKSFYCQRALQRKMCLFDLLAEGDLPWLFSALLLERKPAFIQEHTDDRAHSDSWGKGQLITVNTLQSWSIKNWSNSLYTLGSKSFYMQLISSVDSVVSRNFPKSSEIVIITSLLAMRSPRKLLLKTTGAKPLILQILVNR